MTRAHATTHPRRRHREGWSALGAVALAAISGLLAAHFGTRRAWENPIPQPPTSTSVPFIEPQRIP